MNLDLPVETGALLLSYPSENLTLTMQSYDYTLQHMKLSKARLGMVFAYSSGYRVTDDGVLVASTGQRIKTYTNGKPSHRYEMFPVSFDGIRVHVKTHQLQAYQKYGDVWLHSDIAVRHLDANTTNNSVSNIMIGNLSDNQMDIPTNVRVSRSRKAARTQRKVTPDQVVQIRLKRASGCTVTTLAAEYGLAKSTISYIVNGHTYTLVGADGTEPPP